MAGATALVPRTAADDGELVVRRGIRLNLRLTLSCQPESPPTSSTAMRKKRGRTPGGGGAPGDDRCGGTPKADGILGLRRREAQPGTWSHRAVTSSTYPARLDGRARVWIRDWKNYVKFLSKATRFLFIGSGISTWSGLPTWAEAVEELAQFREEAGFNSDHVRVEAEKGDLIQAASYGLDGLTPPQKREFIRSLCRIGTARPEKIHRKIVSLGPRWLRHHQLR